MKKQDKLGAYPEAEVEPGVTGATQTVYDREADVFGDESNAQVSSRRQFTPTNHQRASD